MNPFMEFEGPGRKLKDVEPEALRRMQEPIRLAHPATVRLLALDEYGFVRNVTTARVTEVKFVRE